ncbi:hypothetical protein GDO78_021571, partial [Eleutherodactylus coqui]
CDSETCWKALLCWYRDRYSMEWIHGRSYRSWRKGSQRGYVQNGTYWRGPDMGTGARVRGKCNKGKSKITKSKYLYCIPYR